MRPHVVIACAATAVALFACTRANAQVVDLRTWGAAIERVQRETNRAHTYVPCNADGRACFDCVDFAITKILALQEIGLPPLAIRFVELENKIGERHAAVAVLVSDKGMPKAVVLDHTLSWVEPMAAYKQGITSIIMIHGGAE